MDFIMSKVIVRFVDNGARVDEKGTNGNGITIEVACVKTTHVLFQA